MRQGRRATFAVLAVGAGVTLVSLLMLWAASVGPGELVSGGRGATERTLPAQTPTVDPAESLRQDPQRFRSSDHPFVTALLLVIEVGIVLLSLYFVYRLLRTLARSIQIRRRDKLPAPVEFDVVEAPGLLVRAIAGDGAAQRAALLGGTPRNGIVECWHRLEQRGIDCGLPQHVWETSAEFALRILDLIEADGGAVARLSDLYREARFSEHDLGEDARQRALTALEDIHRGLAERHHQGSSP